MARTSAFHALSRICLDNFDCITAYWVGMGLKLAQVALSYGADDLHGTIIEEHIFRMAAANPPQLRQREHATESVLQHVQSKMIKAIREAGRTPVQRNTFYEPIKVLENPPESAATENSVRSKMLEDNLATA